MSLSPRVNHGGTHRSTLGPASPGVAVGVGDTLLWGNPSGEASPCRPSRAPLRCDPDRRSSLTASSRCSDPPYISFAKDGGSCAHISAVGGGTHMSSGSGNPSERRGRGAVAQHACTVRYNLTNQVFPALKSAFLYASPQSCFSPFPCLVQHGIPL